MPDALDLELVTIASADPAVLSQWDAVRDLCPLLPPDGWVLIGGLMVQLHAFRYLAGPVRATDDIDLLADSRARPSGTEKMAEVLAAEGFEPEPPCGAFSPFVVHRFVRDGVLVDVLGPDGLASGAGPSATRPHETFAVPGGTQALRRWETVAVRLPGGEQFQVRCPTLTAALVLKARSGVRRARAKDREDLVVLLACVLDPFVLRAGLSAADRRALRRVSAALPADEAGFVGLVDDVRGRRAHQALTLLLADV